MYALRWICALAPVLLLSAPINAASSTLDMVGEPCGADKEADDPILSFQVGSPRNGSVWKLPLTFRLEVGVRSMERYKRCYVGMEACIEVVETVTRCNPILDAEISFDDLPEGKYSARAFITDNGRALRHLVTNTVSFSVVSENAYASYAAKLVEQKQASFRFPRDMTLLEWAHQHVQYEQRGGVLDAPSSTVNSSDPLLVIGVKTAVLSNFARRQTIRETWGGRAQQLHVKVLFLGCVPIVSDLQEEIDRKRLRNAVRAEKRVYGDLLTEELDCEDSYAHLTDKVRAFFHVAVTEFPLTPYVMLADDDIYLQVDKLANMLNELRGERRFYMGQTWRSMYSCTSVPIRDESHPNYLPREQYPMSALPPYAFGPHYVVSMDCARFISKNYWRLRGLNGLEDVSVGLWMLAIQVHPIHTPQFSHLTFQSCKNTLISFAELSTLGIRAIHANLLYGREFCHGYDRITWTSSQALSTTSPRFYGLPTGPLQPRTSEEQSQAEIAIVQILRARGSTVDSWEVQLNLQVNPSCEVPHVLPQGEEARLDTSIDWS